MTDGVPQMRIYGTPISKERSFDKTMKTWKHFCALFLILAVMVGQTACVGSDGESVSEDGSTSETMQQLVVEAPPAVYSEEFLADILPRTADLCGGLVRLVEGAVLGETQKQELTDSLSESVFPMLLEIPVYDTELEQLLTEAEALCAEAESSQKDWAFLFLQLYQNMQRVLDASRAGAIAYRSTGLWLDSQIAVCEERYEKYGNDWDLEDAEAFRDLRNRVTEQIGEPSFTSMTEMLMFMLSAASGAFPTEETLEGFDVSDGDLLIILQKQAKIFEESCVTETQWAIFGELFAHWIPVSDGSLGREELSALKKNQYFANAFCAMPDLLALYSNAASVLTAEDLNALRQGEASVRASTLCRALLSCEAQARAAANGLRAHCSIASDAEAKVVQKAGLSEMYADFCETYTVAEFEALWNAVRKCAESASAENMEALKQQGIGYLRGVAPYLTFILYHTRSAEKGVAVC